jgi:hypothetical protein
MKIVNQLISAGGVALLSLSSSGCMSNGSTTAQAHDDAWCSAHPKQCDNKDWCAKNPDRCSASE